MLAKPKHTEKTEKPKIVYVNQPFDQKKFDAAIKLLYDFIHNATTKQPAREAANE